MVCSVAGASSRPLDHRAPLVVGQERHHRAPARAGVEVAPLVELRHVANRRGALDDREHVRLLPDRVVEPEADGLAARLGELLHVRQRGAPDGVRARRGPREPQELRADVVAPAGVVLPHEALLLEQPEEPVDGARAHLDALRDLADAPRPVVAGRHPEEDPEGASHRVPGAACGRGLHARDSTAASSASGRVVAAAHLLEPALGERRRFGVEVPLHRRGVRTRDAAGVRAEPLVTDGSEVLAIGIEHVLAADVARRVEEREPDRRPTPRAGSSPRGATPRAARRRRRRARSGLGSDARVPADVVERLSQGAHLERRDVDEPRRSSRRRPRARRAARRPSRATSPSGSAPARTSSGTNASR